MQGTKVSAILNEAQKVFPPLKRGGCTKFNPVLRWAQKVSDQQFFYFVHPPPPLLNDRSLNKLTFSPGWRNEDKQNTAPLNRLYYDTNTAMFASFTLSMHMLAISHWLSHIIDVAGESKHDAWVIN